MVLKNPFASLGSSYHQHHQHHQPNELASNGSDPKAAVDDDSVKYLF